MIYIVAINFGLTVYLLLSFQKRRSEYMKILDAQNVIMKALVEKREEKLWQ